MDDEDKEEAYNYFTCVSMVAHEMVHMYQFSPEKLKSKFFK